MSDPICWADLGDIRCKMPRSAPEHCWPGIPTASRPGRANDSFIYHPYVSEWRASQPTLSKKRWWRRNSVEQIKGGELKVGDRVLVECVITSIDQYQHPLASPIQDGHWNADRPLWTWGGEHGAGTNTAPSINRILP